MFDWILTTIPLELALTALALIIVGAAAAIIGWSLGFDSGWDAGHGTTNRTGQGADGAHEGSRLLWESQAFSRGVEAGAAQERARQRQVRSKAGVEAAKTAKRRQNRVTGQVLPVTPDLSGTTTTAEGVTATNLDAAVSSTVSAAAQARTPLTLTGDGPE